MSRQAKGTRNSFTGIVSRPRIKGKQWYADVKGPFTMPSLNYEIKYDSGIIEGTTRYLVQYYTKEKSEVQKCLKQWYDDHIVPLRKIHRNDDDLQHVFFNADMGECTSNMTIDYLKSMPTHSRAKYDR